MGMNAINPTNKQFGDKKIGAFVATDTSTDALDNKKKFRLDEQAQLQIALSGSSNPYNVQMPSGGIGNVLNGSAASC